MKDSSEVAFNLQVECSRLNRELSALREENERLKSESFEELYNAVIDDRDALREELAERKNRLEAANWNKRHSDQDHATELRKVREELARKDKVIQAFHDGYGYQQMQKSLADAERLNAEVRQELSDADEEKMALRRRVIEATAWISDYRRSLDRQSFQDNDEGDRQSRMHSRLCRSLDLFLGLKPTESGARE